MECENKKKFASRLQIMPLFKLLFLPSLILPVSVFTVHLSLLWFKFDTFKVIALSGVWTVLLQVLFEAKDFEWNLSLQGLITFLFLRLWNVTLRIQDEHADVKKERKDRKQEKQSLRGLSWKLFNMIYNVQPTGKWFDAWKEDLARDNKVQLRYYIHGVFKFNFHISGFCQSWIG